jgi:hypothetical protein
MPAPVKAPAACFHVSDESLLAPPGAEEAGVLFERRQSVAMGNVERESAQNGFR